MKIKLLLLFILMTTNSCMRKNVPLNIEFKKDFHPLSEKLIGYGSMFGTFVPDNATKSFINYPPLVDIVKQIPNQVLRFPGGTDAHFYDWDTESIIDLEKIDHEGLRRNLRSTKGIKVRLKDFLELCNKVGAKPSITLPVYQKDSKYIIQLIQRIKNQYPNQEFPFWELGNEHGLELEWKKRLLTVEEYVSTCRPIGEYLIKEFPKSLIAVTGEGYLKRGRSKQWNEALMQKNLQSPFFNSVILHKYIYVAKQIQACEVKDKISYLFAATHREAKNVVEIGKNYFDNYPLLLTEVGIAGIEMNNPDQSDNSTQINQLWWVTELANLDFLLAFMEESSHYPINAVLRHMLLVKNKGKLGRAILQWGKYNNSTAPNIRQGWNPVLHSLLEKLLAEFEGGEFSPINFNLPKLSCEVLKYKKNQYEPLRGAVFKKNKKRGFYILNKTDKSQNIELPLGDWIIETISNEANKIPKNFGDKSHLIKQVANSRSIVIEPFSFTIGIE